MPKSTLEISTEMDYDLILSAFGGLKDMAITDVLTTLGLNGIRSRGRMMWTGAILLVAKMNGYKLRKVGLNFHIYKEGN
jgi:hypothetical protein